MICPHDSCNYESSEQGVIIHFGRMHEGTIKGVLVDCANCGTETRKPKYKLDRSENLFCSEDCHAHWREENMRGENAGGWEGGGKVEIECHHCGSTKEKWKYRVEQYEHNFCDEGCYSDWQEETGVRSGENNTRWRGGHVRYYGPNWLSQRRRVRKRDEYSCQECGISESDSVEEFGRELDVHHIRPLREFEPFDEDEVWGEANALSNLVTLCRRCHLKEENKMDISLED